ncbi:DUF2093 domain-containing protein [Polymorphobacter sp. PAMC 29334]|uniref:DUF2093 domain-containing protein n=1 Tax=Sphingosinicellaceae TaxID=2820280 RepID=UPI00351CEB65
MMLDRSGGRPAKLRYLSGSYQVVAPGDYVLCAVTGARLPVASLRYWSSELQEAYANAEVAVGRYNEMRASGRLA